MRIALDAKRAFHNTRGLGNYSRDVIRLMQQYAPENEYILCGCPKQGQVWQAPICSPQGGWKLMPDIWRSWGVGRDMVGRADIYHGLSGEIPIGLQRVGIQSVVTIHDAIFIRYPELYSATYRELFRQKVQYAVNHADGIIAISEQTKRDCVEFFHADEQKIRVVYQGCHHSFREPITEQQIAYVREKYQLPQNYVLSVGAVEERKNQHRIVEAMRIADIRMPLVLVGGKTQYQIQVEQAAQQAHVPLIVLNNLPLADLPAIYKGAAVMVYPSLFEGFGRPILEAECVGVPVVTSMGGCFEETGGKAAIYVNASSAEDLAQKMSLVLSDTDMRKRMIENGYQQCALFTDEQVARNLIDTYEWVYSQK